MATKIRVTGIIEVDVMCDDPNDGGAVQRAQRKAEDRIVRVLDKGAKRLRANVGLDGAYDVETGDYYV